MDMFDRFAERLASRPHAPVGGRFERFGAPAILSAVSGARLADALSQLGGFDEALGHAEAAVRIAETADHPLTLYFGLFGLGVAHLRRGISLARPRSSSGATSSVARGTSSSGRQSSPRPSAPPTPWAARLTRLSRWSRAPWRSSTVASIRPGAGAHSAIRGDGLPPGRADRRGQKPR